MASNPTATWHPQERPRYSLDEIDKAAMRAGGPETLRVQTLALLAIAERLEILCWELRVAPGDV